MMSHCDHWSVGRLLTSILLYFVQKHLYICHKTVRREWHREEGVNSDVSDCECWVSRAQHLLLTAVDVSSAFCSHRSSHRWLLSITSHRSFDMQHFHTKTHRGEQRCGTSCGATFHWHDCVCAFQPFDDKLFEHHPHDNIQHHRLCSLLLHMCQT